jgi:hypothetical protein
MSAPRVILTLDGEQRTFAPEQDLSGQYLLEGADPAEINAVELSVLWHTEGAGEEDLKVHFFERLEPDNGSPLELKPRRFATRLPKSPLSYDGVIVKIRWCVRARAFLARGKTAVAEQTFRLGHVPAPESVEPAGKL